MNLSHLPQTFNTMMRQMVVRLRLRLAAPPPDAHMVSSHKHIPAVVNGMRMGEEAWRPTRFPLPDESLPRLAAITAMDTATSHLPQMSQLPGDETAWRLADHDPQGFSSVDACSSSFTVRRIHLPATRLNILILHGYGE